MYICKITKAIELRAVKDAAQMKRFLRRRRTYVQV